MPIPPSCSPIAPRAIFNRPVAGDLRYPGIRRLPGRRCPIPVWPQPSRHTVDGARPIPAAMARNERPPARPLEISSRSASVRRRSELPGGRGRRPALSTRNVRIEPWVRPRRRPITRQGLSPFDRVPDLRSLSLRESPHHAPPSSRHSVWQSARVMR